MSTVTVIDLGDLSAPPAPAAPAPLMPPRHSRRRLLVGAVLLACLFGFGGAARPAPPAVRTLWTMEIARYEQPHFTDDLVLLERPEGERAVLTAYDARTGAPRWKRDTDTDPQSVQQVGDLLLLSFTRTRPGMPVPVPETVAVRSDTGATAWRLDGEAIALYPGSALTVGPDVVRSVRLDDGGTVWSRPVPGLYRVTAELRDGRPDRVVTVNQAGDVQVLRPGDGVPAVSGRLPWRPAGLESTRETFVAAVEGYLLTQELGGFGPTPVAVHRLDSMRLQWRQEVTSQAVLPCGRWLCASDADLLRVLDPFTRAEQWSIPGGYSLVPLRDNRTLVVTLPTLDNPVVETSTGRKVGELHGWPVTNGDPDGPLIALQPARSTVSLTKIMAVGRHGGLSLRGTVPFLPGQYACRIGGTVLLCHLPERVVATGLSRWP